LESEKGFYDLETYFLHLSTLAMNFLGGLQCIDAVFWFANVIVRNLCGGEKVSSVDVNCCWRFVDFPF
jgi:hypothetical protein